MKLTLHGIVIWLLLATGFSAHAQAITAPVTAVAGRSSASRMNCETRLVRRPP